MNIRTVGPFISIVSICLIGLIGTATLITGCVTQAEDRGDEVVIEDTIVERDLITAGRQVHLRSTVKGDVVTAGARVVLDGPITGYAIAAGQDVLVRDDVANDLIAAGRRVDVAAGVGDRALLAGNAVHLQPQSVVDSAIIGADTVNMQGRVVNDLRIGARDASLAGRVGGAVRVSAQHVRVLPGANIRGDLIVRGPNPPEIAPGAEVGGKVDYRRTEDAAAWQWWLGMWLWLFLALLVLGLLAIAFSSVWAQRVVVTISSRPGASVLAGLASVILVPVIVAVLAITLVGIPLAVVLLAVYVVLLLLSMVFVAYLVGGWTLTWAGREQPSPVMRVFVGALLLSFVMSLPWVGWIVQIAVVLFGVGAVILERRDFRHQLRGVGLA